MAPWTGRVIDRGGWPQNLRYDKKEGHIIFQVM